MKEGKVALECWGRRMLQFKWGGQWNPRAAKTWRAQGQSLWLFGRKTCLRVGQAWLSWTARGWVWLEHRKGERTCKQSSEPHSKSIFAREQSKAQHHTDSGKAGWNQSDSRSQVLSTTQPSLCHSREAGREQQRWEEGNPITEDASRVGGKGWEIRWDGEAMLETQAEEVEVGDQDRNGLSIKL